MILTKQMESLKRLHTSHQELGKAKTPSLEIHVMMALCSGEVPRLKSPQVVAKTARKKIVANSYGGRSLSFSDVFASCNGYEKEMRAFKAYEKKRASAVAQYLKATEKVMLKALDKDADAEEISDSLHDAAARAGLKDLVAPNFDATSDDD